MAMDKTTIFAAPFKLINHGASGAVNYSSGGTHVGEVLHHATKGLDRIGEFVTRPIHGPVPWDFAWLADVALFEVIIGQRTDEFMKQAYRPQYQTGTPTLIGTPQIKPGHLVRKGGYTHRLQIRPVVAAGTIDDTKPSVYIPYGFVVQVGATVWDEGELHQSATILTIAAFVDESTNAPYYEGTTADLPVVAA